MGGAVLLRWNSHHPKAYSEDDSLEKIVNKDFKNILVHLKKENVKGEEWKNLNDYSAREQDIVTTENARKYFKIVSESSPEIFSCLKKDYCGMKTKNEDDAYFDNQKTPSHIFLSRNLKIMQESLKKDNSLVSLVDWEFIHDLINSGEELVAIEALSISRDFENKENHVEELLKETRQYKGETRAISVEKIGKKNMTKDERKKFTNEIEDIFLIEDASTSISVLEKIQKPSFVKKKYEIALHNLCRFKTMDPIREKNWLMIKYLSKKIDSDFEKMCD